MITSGTCTVYTSFGKEGQARLQLSVREAIEKVSKKEIPAWKQILQLGVSGNTSDGTDVLMPDIKYFCWFDPKCMIA